MRSHDTGSCVSVAGSEDSVLPPIEWEVSDAESEAETSVNCNVEPLDIEEDSELSGSTGHCVVKSETGLGVDSMSTASIEVQPSPESSSVQDSGQPFVLHRAPHETSVSPDITAPSPSPLLSPSPSPLSVSPPSASASPSHLPQKAGTADRGQWKLVTPEKSGRQEDRRHAESAKKRPKYIK